MSALLHRTYCHEALIPCVVRCIAEEVEEGEVIDKAFRAIDTVAILLPLFFVFYRSSL